MTAPDTVTVAYLHNGKEHAASFAHSYKHLLMYDASHHGRIMRGGELPMRCGTGGIVEGRNKVVEEFLKSDIDWLFFIDDDIGFQPDSLERLMEVAHPEHRPIVGGLCFASIEKEIDGYGGYKTAPRPTIMDVVETDGVEHLTGRGWYVPNEVVQCAGTGTAFLLVHRTLLERMGEKFGTWFNKVRLPGASNDLSEDLSFCVRAGHLQAPILVHTGVKTTHMKTVWLSDAYYWRQMIAPPATEQVAVIVPVMERPQNAEPFMTSLRASTGLATAYAVANAGDGDTIVAWKDAGAQVLTADVTTFAEKVNIGYRETREPWLFLVGDDVAFHPGWLDHAQLLAKVTELAVIGTNDLGNPRVMAGDHATHLLIRRDYIDTEGASWDGPENIAHEGYRHWYVDDEIVTAAKQRDQFVVALGSRVEHLHPIWGKGEQDAVYELGQSHAEQDRKLFKGRLKAYG